MGKKNKRTHMKRYKILKRKNKWHKLESERWD